jgi:hypothetical protein
MGQPPTTRAGWASCPGRSAARSDALQTPISGLPEIGTLMGKPDLRGPPQPLAVPDQRCTTRCRSRCIASGTHDLSHLANLNQHTPPRSRGAFSAPELLPLSFAHSDRGVGGAPIRPMSCTHVQPSATDWQKNPCSTRRLAKKPCTAVQPRALTRNKTECRSTCGSDRMLVVRSGSRTEVEKKT